MARTYAYALAGSVDRDLSVLRCRVVYCCPERIRETETVAVNCAAYGLLNLFFAGRFLAGHRGRLGVLFLAVAGLLSLRLGTEFLPTSRKATSGSGRDAADDIAGIGAPFVERHAPDTAQPPGSHHRGVAATAAATTGSDAAASTIAEFFVPFEADGQWTPGAD